MSGGYNEITGDITGNAVQANNIYGPVVVGATTVNINTGRDNRAQPTYRPFMPPPRTHTIVPRSELTDRLVGELCDNTETGPTSLAAIVGVGGVGKTVLAAEACRDIRVQRRFPDGVLWVTLGETTAGAQLASKINDLAAHLSGFPAPFTDPEQAGHHLAQLLADKQCLLVIDDVWRAQQLTPLLINAPGCRRLVTTRVHSALPLQVTPLAVPAMSPAQARALLAEGLPESTGHELDCLLGGTGSWPILLRLVNGALRRYVRHGATVARAAQHVTELLAARGPAALDVTSADQRDTAVAATVEASLSLLATTGEDRLVRYLELAVFPEETMIPQVTLERYWAYTPVRSAPSRSSNSVWIWPTSHSPSTTASADPLSCACTPSSTLT